MEEWVQLGELAVDGGLLAVTVPREGALLAAASAAESVSVTMARTCAPF